MELCYNLRTAAIMLGVKVSTLRYWIKTGKIKAVRYTVGKGGKLYIQHSEMNRIRQEVQNGSGT